MRPEARQGRSKAIHRTGARGGASGLLAGPASIGGDEQALCRRPQAESDRERRAAMDHRHVDLHERAIRKRISECKTLQYYMGFSDAKDVSLDKLNK
jgi:hypothetical protein